LIRCNADIASFVKASNEFDANIFVFSMVLNFKESCDNTLSSTHSDVLALPHWPLGKTAIVLNHWQCQEAQFSMPAQFCSV
jgi:hypothetical protein